MTQNAPTTLAGIYAKQDWWQQRYDRAHERMNQAERTLASAGNHLGVVPMVEQIAALLRPQFPNQVLNVLGPFGLGHTTSIHAYPLGADPRGIGVREILGSLTFRPYSNADTNYVQRLVLVDYSKPTRQYPPKSLGAYNGLNYAEVDVPEISVLVDMLWQQIKEKVA